MLVDDLASEFDVATTNFCFKAGTRTIDVELTTLSSTHHVELNPSDAGFQDRYVVQEIIKEMAKNRPIDTKGRKGFKGILTSHLIYILTRGKVILQHQVHV